jgi:hypothetical protein
MVVRFVAIVAIVATFTIFLADWDVDSPTVSGYADLRDTVDTTNPNSGFPQFPVIQAPQSGACDWWNVACVGADLGASVVYIGVILWSSVSFGFLALAWFFGLVFSLFAVLLTSASLTMAGMPTEIQTLLWILVLPFLVLLILAVLRFFRGNEG